MILDSELSEILSFAKSLNAEVEVRSEHCVHIHLGDAAVSVIDNGYGTDDSPLEVQAAAGEEPVGKLTVDEVKSMLLRKVTCHAYSSNSE